MRNSSEYAFSRAERMEPTIQKALAQVMAASKDPRFKLATVNAVNLSPDLKSAKIYITVREDDTVQKEAVLAALNKAAGFFRTKLAQQSTSRGVPRLNFVYDASVDYSRNIDGLLSEVLPSESEVE